MNFIYRFWDRVFFCKFDPFSLTIFRIIFGTSILTVFIASIPNWENLYSSNGMMSLNEATLPPLPMDGVSIFHYLELIVPIKFFLWLGIVSSITFTIGLFTKFSTVILFILFLSMFYRNPFVACGYDVVFRILLFFNLFVPLNYYFSIDNLFIKKRSELPLIWPIRLMQISIASIYLITFYRKVAGEPAWLNGDAIYWIITNKYWSIFPYPELFYKWGGILSKLLTYVTLMIEISFPFLVWFKKTRLLIILIATIFHICIALVIPETFPFTMVMISSFILFLPSEVMRGWFDNKFKVTQLDD